MTVKTNYSAVVIQSSIENLLLLGNYDYINQRVSNKNFPQLRTGADPVDILILKLEVTNIEAALAEISKRGFRPANIFELLALGVLEPELEPDEAIFALGSICMHPEVGSQAPVLFRRRSEPGINVGLNGTDCLWGGNFLFACVRL